MRKIVIIWIILLAVLYSALSIVRHNHFQSGGFDLGLYDQSVWQYSKFLSPYNTVKERFVFGDHLTLTLPLLAPLFWIWNDVRMLLLFQAVWISASTYAIYTLCLHRKFSDITALCVSIIYSLFYGIQAAVFFDFHPVVIGVGLIAWLILFLETKRKKLFWITLILLVLTQENMGIALICLAAIYFWKKQWRNISIAFVVIGIAWSIISSKVIAGFSPIGFQYLPQISTNPMTILKNFFDSEEKRQVWLYSFSWFSFLPLLSPGAVLAVVIDLAQYFVTGPEFSRMWSPLMHHRAILAPFLTLGMLDALVFLQKRRVNPQIVAIGALIIAFGFQFYFHFPLNKLSKADYWKDEPWMKNTKELLTKVPSDASVVTQQDLVPHLSHRKEIYLFFPRPHDFDDPSAGSGRASPCGQRSCWWLDFNNNAKYLVVDLHPNQWITQLLETTEHVSSAVTNMEKSGKITLTASSEGLETASVIITVK